MSYDISWRWILKMDTNELLYKQKWPYNIASESHSIISDSLALH